MENFDIGALLGGGGGQAGGVMAAGLPADWWPMLMQKLQDPNAAAMLAAQAAPPQLDAPMPVAAETSTPMTTGAPAGTPPLLPPATPPIPVNAQGVYNPAPRGNFDLPPMGAKPGLGELLKGAAGFTPKPVAAPAAAVNPGNGPSVGGATPAKYASLNTPLSQRNPNLSMTLGQLLGAR